MRIAILHYAAPPIIGGVERVIYYHARLLAALGHEISVIAGRGEPFDPTVAFYPVDLIDSRHPEIAALKSELDQGIVSPTFAAVIERIEANLAPILEKADVLIAHNVLSLHKNLMLTAALHQRAAAGCGPRLIAWHHDLAWTASRYLPELHDGYPWDLLRQAWPNTQHVTVSSARRDEVAAIFGIPAGDIKVIPGGIDAADFLGIDGPTADRLSKLGILEADPMLLLPSRITRRKNIELALRVTAMMQERCPRVKLIVTGPPGPHNAENTPYFDELKALRSSLGLNNQALFLTEELGEPPDNSMMKALYRLAGALIFPSFEEGFGLPILEAGLARLPIFCADIPALRELARDGAHYFSPFADAGVVAQQIEQVLSTSQTAHLRNRVLNDYDWSGIVRRYVEPLISNA